MSPPKTNGDQPKQAGAVAFRQHQITPDATRSRIRDRSHGRNLDDVFRIVIDQLEPVFGDVGRRENVVLQILGVERQLQIRFAESLPPVAVAMARLIAIAFARSTIEAMIAPLIRSLR